MSGRTPPCGPAPEVPNPRGVKVVGVRQPGETRASRAGACAHCGLTLEWNPGDGWTAPNGPGLDGRNPQCSARPGEDAYGPHEPGTPIVHPPREDCGEPVPASGSDEGRDAPSDRLPRSVVVAMPPTKAPATPLEAEIADMLWAIETNYNREGTGYGSRFAGERLEVVQARAVIRRIREVVDRG